MIQIYDNNVGDNNYDDNNSISSSCSGTNSSDCCFPIIVT